ncbi:hypothetical protein CLOM621_07930 [Clostridium sp. M62/1]|nr:hypothetical protein CLOM621_07930 [Clostridium sp. M62/1]
MKSSDRQRPGERFSSGLCCCHRKRRKNREYGVRTCILYSMQDFSASGGLS